MKEMFKNKILDELFELREEEFAKCCIAKYGRTEDSKKNRKCKK